MQKKRSLAAVSLLLIILLSVIPLAFTGGYLVFNTRDELENTARQTVDFYIDQFATRTETVLKSLRDSIFILTTDDEIRSAMQPDGNRRMAGAEQNAGRIITGSSWEQGTVTGMFIFKDSDHYISVLREGIYAGGTRRAITAYEEFVSYNSARTLVVTPSNPGYCYMVADYFDISSMRPLGKIVIELDAAALVRSESLDKLYNGSQAVLRDLDGAILYSADDALTASLSQAENDTEDYTALLGQSYYHSSKRLTSYNLLIDVYVPRNQIFSTINSTLQVYILFVATMLAVTLLAGVAVFTRVVRPLRGMVKAIDEVAKGDLSVQMPHTPYRETEQITTAFNSMTEHLARLFDEVYQSGLLLRDAEYKSLEAQINPHFIFNVLEVINMRASCAGQEDICQMVTHLANLLRGNLSHRDKQKLTFEQELEYVRFYLELQKLRFEDDLCYEIEADNSIRSLYLPKLTIQPIVENSVVHGLENKRGGGTVRLHISQQAQQVNITVKDDGVGFDAANINLDKPVKPEGRRNHVALYNINRRIQLLYGEAYGLSVESRPDEGSTVTLTLPADRGEEPLAFGHSRESIAPQGQNPDF